METSPPDESAQRALAPEERAAHAERRATEAEQREREALAALATTQERLAELELRLREAEERAEAAEIGAVAVAGAARQQVQQALAPRAEGVVVAPQRSRHLVEAELVFRAGVEDVATLAHNYWASEGFKLSEGGARSLLEFRRGGIYAEVGSMKAGLLTGWKRGLRWEDAPLLVRLRLKQLPDQTHAAIEIRVGDGWGPLKAKDAEAAFRREFREPAERLIHGYALHVSRWEA